MQCACGPNGAGLSAAAHRPRASPSFIVSHAFSTTHSSEPPRFGVCALSTLQHTRASIKTGPPLSVVQHSVSLPASQTLPCPTNQRMCGSNSRMSFMTASSVAPWLRLASEDSTPASSISCASAQYTSGPMVGLQKTTANRRPSRSTPVANSGCGGGTASSSSCSNSSSYGVSSYSKSSASGIAV